MEHVLSTFPAHSARLRSTRMPAHPSTMRRFSLITRRKRLLTCLQWIWLMTCARPRSRSTPRALVLPRRGGSACRRGEAEVSGDHRSTLRVTGRGHGRRASSFPMTTTMNKNVPRMNRILSPHRGRCLGTALSKLGKPRLSGRRFSCGPRRPTPASS